VNDTFFYSSSTGAIVSSLVTTTNYVNYQLGNLDYKIRSVTDGIQYMTCDSTLGNTNISNLSVDNLSTDLLNNISAGENITLSTEAGTNNNLNCWCWGQYNECFEQTSHIRSE
jgi:hypothetical protein